MSENLNEIEAPACPECNENYTYELGELWACPLCGHEWERTAAGEIEEAAGSKVLDSVGNELVDGDSVTIVKGLKVKGGADIKAGTKVRGIRLLESPVNGHDIEAKVPGAGQMYLKAAPPALAPARGGAAFVHEGLREPSIARIVTSCRSCPGTGRWSASPRRSKGSNASSRCLRWRRRPVGLPPSCRQPRR